MASKDKYITSLEEKMEKYKDQISKIDSILSSYESRGKEHLLSESEGVREKYKEAQKILKNLKTSSTGDFEDLKDSSLALFNDLKEGLGQFSHLLTMDKIIHAKDEVAEYGMEKVSEAEEYVKKNPFTSAAIALATGFAVGALVRRLT